MSDPQHLDFGDWFQIAVGSLVTGMGGAMAWFSGAKKKMEARMTSIEDVHGKQTTELAVIHSNQDHLSSRMDEVRELGLSAHRKLDEVLREVRRH